MARVYLFTVRLGRRRLGPFGELRRALEVLRAERSGPHDGEVLVEVLR